jgi:putative cell wall-binding protein
MSASLLPQRRRRQPATAQPTETRSWPQRVADRTATALGRRRVSRRGFLGGAAVVGSALAVDPWGFVLKPRTAYASACGRDTSCDSGWTAFCCTVNNGANTCPPGSYVAGWWKVDDSAFCRGEARYYVDCNRTPGVDSCDPYCADGPCDKRRVCTNVFRYGQCNQQIEGVTEVVCRIVVCTPPWIWDPACTTTVRTEERTRTHSATCLPGENPTFIQIDYQDLGLTGSVLGSPTGGEGDAGGGGRVRAYENGLIMWRSDLGAHHVLAPLSGRYDELGRERSALGYPITDPRSIVDGGQASDFENGVIWYAEATGAWETYDTIHQRYLSWTGPAGWLGFPVSGAEPAPGDRLRSDFASGWSIAADPANDESRILPSETELPQQGWPPQASVRRWAGNGRVATAATVSANTFESRVPAAYIARADGFADALAGGVAAALDGGPVLLTQTDRLPEETKQELRRLAPQKIVVLGGRNAVSEDGKTRLRTYTEGSVDRLAGDGRFATAAAISEATFDQASTVYVATGGDFADALAGVPAAASASAPILLTGVNRLPQPTIDELERLSPDNAVILGGTAAVSKQVESELNQRVSSVRRVQGDGRYETAAATVAQSTDSADDVVVATGQAYPDGLSAGPAAVALGGPVVLTPLDDIPEAVDAELQRLGPDRITVVGGTTVISGDVAERLSYFPVAESGSSDPSPSPSPSSSPSPSPSPSESASPSPSPSASSSPSPSPSPSESASSG